ncbi:MAG: HDOD domain-containing protein [Terriglobales bacterium]
MADSVLLLQVLLSGPAVNLRSVAEVIRSDVGLTIQLLRLVSLEQGEHRPIEASVATNVVHAGVDKLLTLVTELEPLSSHPRGREALRECEQFWGHARLTALMAEELAYKNTYNDPEEAYLAGLLFHIGELPSILGWQWKDADAEPHEIAGVLAKEWRLPAILQDVVCGNELRSSSSLPLLKLITEADEQARRIRGLVAKFARGVF